jgi:hypothetical protein
VLRLAMVTAIVELRWNPAVGTFGALLLIKLDPSACTVCAQKDIHLYLRLTVVRKLVWIIDPKTHFSIHEAQSRSSRA